MFLLHSVPHPDATEVSLNTQLDAVITVIIITPFTNSITILSALKLLLFQTLNLRACFLQAFYCLSSASLKTEPKTKSLVQAMYFGTLSPIAGVREPAKNEKEIIEVCHGQCELDSAETFKHALQHCQPEALEAGTLIK